jgi:hypothetical protein
MTYLRENDKISMQGRNQENLLRMVEKYIARNRQSKFIITLLIFFFWVNFHL